MIRRIEHRSSHSGYFLEAIHPNSLQKARGLGFGTSSDMLGQDISGTQQQGGGMEDACENDTSQ